MPWRSIHGYSTMMEEGDVIHDVPQSTRIPKDNDYTITPSNCNRTYSCSHQRLGSSYVSRLFVTHYYKLMCRVTWATQLDVKTFNPISINIYVHLAHHPLQDIQSTRIYETPTTPTPTNLSGPSLENKKNNTKLCRHSIIIVDLWNVVNMCPYYSMW